MGAYLSEPVTEKVSSDEANDKLECGASSMQGWRVNQEVGTTYIVSFMIISVFRKADNFIMYNLRSISPHDQFIALCSSKNVILTDRV